MPGPALTVVGGGMSPGEEMVQRVLALPTSQADLFAFTWRILLTRDIFFSAFQVIT